MSSNDFICVLNGQRVYCRIYRGTGPVNITTPNGEVKACSGDLIVHFQHGQLVLDQLSAKVLFGNSIEQYLSLTPKNSETESLEATLEKTPAFSFGVQDAVSQQLSRHDLLEISKTLQSSTPIAVVNANAPSSLQTDESLKKTSIDDPLTPLNEQTAADKMKAAFGKV